MHSTLIKLWGSLKVVWSYDHITVYRPSGGRGLAPHRSTFKEGRLFWRRMSIGSGRSGVVASWPREPAVPSQTKPSSYSESGNRQSGRREGPALGEIH